MNLEEEARISKELLEGLKTPEEKEYESSIYGKTAFMILQTRWDKNIDYPTLLKKLKEQGSPMTKEEIQRCEVGDPSLFPEKYFEILRALGAKNIHIDVEFETNKKVIEA